MTEPIISKPPKVRRLSKTIFEMRPDADHYLVLVFGSSKRTPITSSAPVIFGKECDPSKLRTSAAVKPSGFRLSSTTIFS
jgi:hypothetical protein